MSNPCGETATADFFGPVALAYVTACGVWLGLERLGATKWPHPELPKPARPWLELLCALLAAAAIFGLGELWRRGLLVPGHGWLAYEVNTLVIYSPIAIVSWLRRAPLATVLLDKEALPRKVLAGLGLGLLAVTVYHVLRGELHKVPETLAGCCTARSLEHFVPVFLEAVAVAFLWVRLRWLLGPTFSLLVPCLLFALGHVPGGIAAGESLGTIAAFLVFNTLLPLVIFGTVVRSRDVLWIGLVHYMMDVAIHAFDA